jgi:adenylate kinase family enzyme
VFNEQTRPVIDFYGGLNKLKKIDANRAIEAITTDVEAHLDSIGVFAQP